MLELNCLPDEILVEILSKLPIKTLILCTCTCKWMFSFIRGPIFMTAHMQKGAQNSPLIFLKYYTSYINKDYFFIQPDDCSFNWDFSLIDMPVRYCDCVVSSCRFSVVGVCNGVICLCNGPCGCDYANAVFLWNPSIRKSVALPRVRSSCDGVLVGLGFGFDTRVNDFKVVRLVNYECPCPVTIVAEVYSLRSKSWRVVESFSPIAAKYEISYLGYSHCFVRGTLHWVGCNESYKGGIVSFNVEDELFGEIKMPECLDDGGSEDLAIMEVGKCQDKLALICLTTKSNMLSIWVMREYGMVDSWSATCRIDFPGRYPKPVAFGFRKSGEIILFATDEISSGCDRRHLVLLVGLNGLVINVLGMVDAVSCSLFMDTYVESLALFREGRAMLDNKFCDD